MLIAAILACVLAPAGGLAVGDLRPAAQAASLPRESLRTLQELSAVLARLQVDDPAIPDSGAIRCPACGVLHTRAAEAVYPFAVVQKRTGQPEYGARAKRLAASVTP